MRKSIYSKNYAAFLAELRRTRKRARLSQAELAKRIGKDQAFVSRCERGERRMDVIELHEFCQAMGTSLITFSRRLNALL